MLLAGHTYLLTCTLHCCCCVAFAPGPSRVTPFPRCVCERTRVTRPTERPLITLHSTLFRILFVALRGCRLEPVGTSDATGTSTAVDAVTGARSTILRDGCRRCRQFLLCACTASRPIKAPHAGKRNRTRTARVRARLQPAPAQCSPVPAVKIILIMRSAEAPRPLVISTWAARAVHAEQSRV